MNAKENKERKLWWRFSLPISIVAFTLCLAAGYGLSLLLFGVTGRPADIWATIISGMIGICVFAIGAKIAVEISIRRRHKDGGARSGARQAVK